MKAARLTVIKLGQLKFNINIRQIIFKREIFFNVKTKMIILTFLAYSAVLSASTGREIPIGTIFKKTGMEEMNDVFNAMRFAMDSISSSNRSRDFMLKFYVDKIDTVDPYKLTKVICKQVNYNYRAIKNDCKKSSANR